MTLGAELILNKDKALLHAHSDMHLKGGNVINQGEILSQGLLSTSLSDSFQNEGFVFSQQGMNFQFDEGFYNVTPKSLYGKKVAHVLSYGDITFENRKGTRSQWVENVSGKIETVSPLEVLGATPKTSDISYPKCLSPP